MFEIHQRDRFFRDPVDGHKPQNIVNKDILATGGVAGA
jgi:hypothetical protein